MAQTQSGSAVTISPQDPQPLSETLSRKVLFSILIGVILGMLLAALDQTIVGTALPTIVTSLGGFNHYAWVVTAYLLASTVSIPIWGKLSDIYGRRTFFILGMVIFLVGSALAGTSQNMTQLIIYRFIQGLGAGAMMPIAMAIIGDIFPPAERGKWQGLIVAVFGLASIIGPTLGGWITDNWGWRWVFYVNMPVGVIAILTAGFVMPKLVTHRQHIIDYLGVVTLIAGTVPLLLAFSWGGTQYAWGSWQIISLFTFSVVMLVIFFLVEMRATEPIISPQLFKNSIFTVSTISMFLVSAGMFGAILYLPLFVQGVLGNSATDSGLVLTPLMLGFMFSSIVGGQLLSRTGRYKILAMIGFTIAAIGMFLLSRMTPDTSQGEVVRNMLITGLGIGVMMSLFTIVVQNAFPYRQLGEVTASLTFFRSIGSTMGVAIMGTIMNNEFQNALQTNIPSLLKRTIPADRLAQLENPQLLLAPSVVAKIQHGFAALGPQGLIIFKQLIEAIQKSLSTAITSVFFLGFIIMVLGFITVLFLREIPLRKSNTAPVVDEIKSTSETNSSQVLLDPALALVANEEQVQDANLHEWSDEQRDKAIRQDIVEPMSVSLVASSVGNAEGHTNGASPIMSEEADPKASDLQSSDSFIS